MISDIRPAVLAAMGALLALVLVACGGAGPAETPVPAATASALPFASPTPAFAVAVTDNVDYVKLLGPGAPVQQVDIYAPAEPGPWPVLVLMPAVFQSKDSAAYTSLGEEVAGRGLVVFVPQRRSQSATILEAAHDNGIEFREVDESCACAVQFARDRAPDFGGDPGWITVFGHGGAGLETALIGDDLAPLWDEFASRRGGPPPQAECLAAGASAQVDAYITYAGDFHVYEVLKDSDPALWELTSPLALVGRSPGLLLHIVRGEGDAATLLNRAVEYHQALVDAGYDAALTVLGTGGTTIPWSGPDREALIQVILEAAHH